MAELEAVFGEKNVKPIVIKERFIDYAYIEHPDPAKLMDRLGGTIKIVKIQQILSQKADIAPAMLESLISNYYPDEHKRLVFGINIYPIQKSNEFYLNKLIKSIKPQLKSQKIVSRYLNKDSQNVHTASILENKLVSLGTDLNVFFVDHKILFGHTIGIQNINSYSYRDYQRPARDDKSGMLPPKLAQMLINLASPALDSQKAPVVYDPFCGSGTILQEARLMGFKVIGSDLSPKAVKDTKTNMEWLTNNSTVGDDAEVIEVALCDATKSNAHSQKLFNKANAVVCEGYLGPALASQLPPEEIQAVQKTLIPLYKQALTNISQSIKPGTIVVIAMPAHYFKTKIFFLPQMADHVKHLRMKQVIYCRRNQNFLSPRNTLIYKRPQQSVGREIWILKK